MKVRSWRPATALGLSVARLWLCRFETVTAEFLNRCGRRLDHLPFPRPSASRSLVCGHSAAH